MIPKVYADTSVLGGCEDEEFREPSRRLLQEFMQGSLKLVLSELTLLELEMAPAAVREIVTQIPAGSIEIVPVSEEAEDLAASYIAEGAVSPRMRADALHIAIATVARVDVLVSWNFKHIVNLKRIHAYNSVNLKVGYPTLEIRTPREVFDND